MSPSPLDPIFWSEEAMLLREAFGDLVVASLLAGAENGIGLLPLGHQQLISWDVFNQQALDFLRQYNLETVEGINATTRKQVVQLINDWVLTGDPLPVLQQNIMNMPTFAPARAKSIATTEITRIYAEGNLQMWRSTGLVGGKKWQTARDELVCPICRPLHNQIVQIDTAFEIPDDKQSPELRRQILAGQVEEFHGAPPAHTNCRCWLQPIVSIEGLERELEEIFA